MSNLNKHNNYAGRVNYAAQIISKGGNTSRAFDNCFENYDGDAVAAALIRRSEKNERLRANLPRYLRMDLAIANFEQYKGKNLTEVARQLRDAKQS